MQRILKSNLVLLIVVILMFLTSCAEVPRKNINWNDRRCVTVHDVWVRYNYEKKNSLNVLTALATEGLRSAHKINTGGGVVTVESITGDDKRVWVTYNELGEITSIKDMEGIEISLADLDRLGPFINDLDYSAKNNPAYRLAWDLRYKNLIGNEAFRAAKRPASCDQ